MTNINGQIVHRIVAIGSFVVICAAASAKPYSMIQTPPDAAVDSLATEETLHQLVLFSLVAGNCGIADMTSGDAGLLAGTAQMVAERMTIGADRYFSDYVYPAMAQIATPDGCNRHADAARAMIGHVKDIGGAVLEE